MVEINTANVAPEDMDETISNVVDIIEQRVRDIEGSDFAATTDDAPTISFEFAGLEADAARRVFESGSLDFREPALNNLREITCQAADGSQFHVDPLAVAEAVSDTGEMVAQCVGTAGENGTVVWEPAMAADAEGELRQLTGAHLKPGTAQVLTGPGQCVPACVQLEFTNEGSLLFEQITTRLINYPLGVFIDGQLIWAPQVNSSISNGRTIVSGLSLDEADAVKAQLNSGPLPVPATIVSIEELTSD